METVVRPWIESTWQHIQHDLEGPRVPHAWCLTGAWGLGLATVSDRLVARLLCPDVREQSACGRCQSCRFLMQGAHPDRLKLTAEGAAGRIRIDAVRDAIALVYSTSTLWQVRVIDVTPADALNTEASNALLKVVEEPPVVTRFVFSTHLPGALLPTLRSRMRLIDLSLASWDAVCAEGGRIGLSEAQVSRGQWLLQEPFVGHDDPSRLADAEVVLKTLQSVATGADPQWGANQIKGLSPILVLTVMVRIVESCLHGQADSAGCARRFGPEAFQAPFPEASGLFQLLDRIHAQRMPTARGIAHMALPGFGSLLAVWSHLWSKVQRP